MRPPTQLCVSLTSPATEAALADMRLAAAQADLVELRLDYMEELDLPALLADRPCPVIVTNRPTREGGRYEGDEASRLEPLLRAIELGAEHIDIEHDVDLSAAAGWASLLTWDGQLATGAKLIISYHNFDLTPPDLWDIHQRLADTGADIVKLAVMAHDVADCAIIFDVLRRAELPTICLGMGPAGLLTRILAAKFGAYLTFATLGTGAVSGPGQPTVEELRSTYHFGRLTPDTTVIGRLAPDANDWPHYASLNALFADRELDALLVPVLAPAGRDPLPSPERLGLSGFIAPDRGDEARPLAAELSRFVGEDISKADVAAMMTAPAS